MEVKQDIKNIIILALIFTIVLCIDWGYWGHAFIDNGREFYLPQLIQEGKVLYKDIFGMYNPLSYQINTLLYMCFGQSINILAIAGILNSFIIISSLYFISRFFINPFNSLMLSVFTTLFFVFHTNGQSSFILPYAYAFIYAMSSFFLSLLFSLLYIKNEKNIYIMLSFLMFGISIANKPDFILFLIPLTGLFLVKKTNLKTVIISFLLMILPFALSWGILFMQGFSFDDLKSYIGFIQALFNSEEQKRFNTLIAPKFDMVITPAVIYEFVMFFSIMSLFFIGLKKIKQIPKNIFAGIVMIFMAIVISYIMTERVTIDNLSLFSWVCIADILILILFFKKTDLMYKFLLITIILSCTRLNYLLVGSGYSIYYSVLAVTGFYIFLCKYSTLTEKYNIKQYLFVPFLIMGIMVFLLHSFTKHLFYEPIHNYNNIGTLKINFNHTIPFNQAAEWIMNNTKREDIVLMLPEGPMINFITGRPSNPLYYHLIPNHISALGEEKIVKGLNENKPNYILINNMNYKSSYGKAYICKDFGLEICSFIHNNYELKERYQTINLAKKIFYIEIYKLKEN